MPQTILRDICKFVNNTIYAIVPFSRPDMLENVKNNFVRQKFLDKKLIIVENGPAIGACKKYNFQPDILLTSDAHQSHAKNTAINELNKRGGGFWTTLDDDDWYGKSLHFSEMINVYAGNGNFVSTKQIKDIRPGDFVRSRDEITGDTIFTEVLELHSHGDLDLVEVELETGEKTRCTLEHKFRTIETGKMLSLKEIIYKGLSIVVENMSVLLQNNIKSIKQIGKAQTYDIEVAHPDHQFYLANGILTSNSYLSELDANRNKAAIIGKYEIFVQMSDGELNLFLGAFENAFTEYVHGPTISAMAENSIEFSSANEWGEDGQWVYDMRQLGAHLYSTSRWNFVVQRTPHPHTWEATDDQIRQIYFRREPLVGKNYGKVSYEFVERTIPEPEFDFIRPIPFDIFRDNPAHNALKKKITTRTDEQAQELARKILNGTLKSNQGG